MVYQGPAAVTPGNTDQPAADSSPPLPTESITVPSGPPFPPSSTKVSHRLFFFFAEAGLIPVAAVSSKVLRNMAQNGHMVQGYGKQSHLLGYRFKGEALAEHENRRFAHWGLGYPGKKIWCEEVCQ